MALHKNGIPQLPFGFSLFLQIQIEQTHAIQISLGNVTTNLKFIGHLWLIALTLNFGVS
jgi:hypothetical protein